MGLLAQIVREPDSIDTPSIDWTAFTPLLVLVGGAILLLMISGGVDYGEIQLIIISE